MAYCALLFMFFIIIFYSKHLCLMGLRNVRIELFFFSFSLIKITVKPSLSLSEILPRQKNQNLPILPTSHSATHLHLHEDYQKLFLAYVGLLSFALHHTINNERTNYKQQEKNLVGKGINKFESKKIKKQKKTIKTKWGRLYFQ